MKVKDKRIIVTGAGAGIGKELALQLLEAGAYVIGIDINKDNLDKLKEEAKNDNLLIYQVDITNEFELNEFKREYFNINSQIDGLINNAGIIQPFINVNELDYQTIDKVMNVNFYGALKLTKIFLPYFLDRKEAHIVNVSSMGGFFPFPGQSIYGASKAALKLFTEGLYAELLDTNVKVTLVFPGAIATDIATNSGVVNQPEEGSSNFKMLPAKDAAKQIINAMEKNKLHAYVGKDSKFMNKFYKLFPKNAIKFIKKQMDQIK